MTSQPAEDPQGQLPSQRIQPHSIEAEVCVLGSMILHAPCIDSLVQVLHGEHFFRPAHQQLFDLLVEMHDGREAIDLVTFAERLRQRDLMETVGGIDYVAAMVEGLPDASHAEYYARIVRDKAMLRQLISACTRSISEAYHAQEDAAQIVDRAEQSVFEIAQQHIGEEGNELRDLLHDTLTSLEATQGQLITGLASGYDELDEMTSGFQNGEMIILAARPSMGKTSILLNMAEHLAVRDQRPIALFSLEMSKQQLSQRFLASCAQFNLRQMRRGAISDESWRALNDAAGLLHNAPIFIDDVALLTPLQLRAKARRLKSTRDISCIFIDYLQLMTHPASSRMPRHEQITEISRAIKSLARELEIPVVCAAQLNRGPTDRPTHRPRMSDLRESGSIEQDADVIMLLHREDYYHQGEEGYMPTNITELIVAKQRNGPTGTVNLIFRPDITRFESAATDGFAAVGN
jgi:replicative DNA helicase